MKRVLLGWAVLAAAVVGCKPGKPAREVVPAEKLAAMAEDLRYGDTEARCFAARALGRTQDARAVEPLVRALNDEAHSVQKGAAQALVAIGEPSVRPLIEALDSEYSDVRRAAAAALMDITGRSFGQKYGKWREWYDERKETGKLAEGAAGEVPIDRIGRLVRKLSAERADVRAGAAGELADIGDERALEPLIAALDDPYEYVRRVAAFGLGKMGDPGAVGPLLKSFRGSWNRSGKDADVNVVTGALLATGMPGVEGLIGLLQDEDGSTRHFAWRALKKRTHQDSPRRDGYEEKRKKWREMSQAGIGQLIELLRHEGPQEGTRPFGSDIRAIAAEILGKTGDERALSALMVRLRDGDAKLRELVAQILGTTCDERAVGPLTESLGDEKEDVRLEAVKALGNLTRASERAGKQRVTGALIGSLRDKDDDVRFEAAKALGNTGDESAVVPLRELWQEARGDVRHRGGRKLYRRKKDLTGAAFGLVMIAGDQDALDSLIEAFKQDPHDVEDALEALVTIGAPAVEPLIEALSDEKHRIRKSSARALGMIGLERAVGPLTKVLKSDRHRDERRRAAEALGKIGDERAIQALIEALKDGDVRASAAEALKKMTKQDLGAAHDRWKRWYDRTRRE